MNTPVSFDIFKLLKEKGFESIQIVVDGQPVLTEVVIWLYEKHEIWISVVRNDTKDLFNYIATWNNGLCENESRGKGYNTPTEAYSEAIEYALKNLI